MSLILPCMYTIKKSFIHSFNYDPEEEMSKTMEMMLLHINMFL